VALVFTALAFRQQFRDSSVVASIGLAAAGAASGIVYTLVVHTAGDVRSDTAV
jgi:hypothetical protein